MDLTELTALHNRFWEFMFRHYMAKGESQDNAEQMAWNALEEAFPECGVY